MAALTVDITPDTTKLAEALRIIARHADECAAELDALTLDNQEGSTDEAR